MKRTQILIEPADWNILASIAKREDSSVGGLIRYAIKKTFINNQRDIKRSQAVDAIFNIRRFMKNIDYKELINDGRKY